MSLFRESEHRILRLIYENPGIRLSSLIEKARVSAATAKKRLEHLASCRIIVEKKIVGGKKTLLKNFYPDFSSEEGKNVFSLVESEKKQQFFKANKILIGPFKQLLENADKGIRIILIFGSFAADSQTEDSDLDILFLINKKIDKQLLKKEIERSFATFNQEVSPRVDTFGSFKKNLNTGVYQTVIKNHIVIKGSSEFIRLVR